MVLLVWDASALAKRYAEEIGSETVDALFSTAPTRSMISTPWGYTETYSILLRRLNGGNIDQMAYSLAVTSLQAEVILGSDFVFLSISDATIFRSITLMAKHNLNATDAAILTTVLEKARTHHAPQYILVATDKRLLRAAELEGLKTINPELLTPQEIHSFWASL